MKNKERIAFIISGLIVSIIASAISAYAAKNYIYNTHKTSYNKNNSELVQTNIQGMKDELYDKATEYNNLLSRANTLSGYFKTSPSSYLNENGIELNASSNAGTWAYVDFHYNGSTADYTSRIIEDASGRLNFTATNGVRVASNPIFVTQDFTSSTVNMTAKQEKEFTINISKTGYKLAGILQIRTNHAIVIKTDNFWLSDNNTILHIWAYNTSTSAQSTYCITTAVFAREELFK